MAPEVESFTHRSAARAVLGAVAESVRPRLGTATTLAVVATDATLDNGLNGRSARPK